MSEKRAPTPWRVIEDENSQVNGYPNISGPNDELVVGSEGFYGDFDRNWADARLVVKAVNNHDQLVSMVKFLAKEFAISYAFALSNGIHPCAPGMAPHEVANKLLADLEF